MTLSQERRIFGRSFSAIDASNDDDVFRNVSLITQGEAKGHSCQIDATTLKQLLDCSKRFKKGVRANAGHFTGVENAFGYIDNIRIEGEKLLGDLHLFKEHPSYALTKRQIETIPDTIGFSVYFNGPDEEKEETVEGHKIKIAYARCEELFSADLVTEPAANPSGVFQKGVDRPREGMAALQMDSEDLKKLLQDHTKDICASHQEHMDDMSDKMSKLQKKVESIGTNDTPVKPDTNAAALDDDPAADPADPEKKDAPAKKEDPADDDKPMSRKAIDARLRSFSKDITNDLLKALSQQKISPPASDTAGSPASEKALSNKPKFKTFHEAYRAQRALGKGKVESMKLAASEYPELNKAYCLGQENGEAWTREPLDAKDPVRMHAIISTGRLI